MVNYEGLFTKLRKYSILEILDALIYLIKTGCQWKMLPHGFPHWKAVYHHFRSLSDRGWFRSMLNTLSPGHIGLNGITNLFVDSQSIRSALNYSQKGIDGNKRIKGIKRHIAVDQQGYVVDANVTKANVHDSRGVIPILGRLAANKSELTVKGDLGYKSAALRVNMICTEINVECVQSNHGTSDFIPIDGRWVVERTFSWMESYRRLNRNYERLLKVAEHIFIASCMFFVLRNYK